MLGEGASGSGLQETVSNEFEARSKIEDTKELSSVFVVVLLSYNLPSLPVMASPRYTHFLGRIYFTMIAELAVRR